MSSKTAVEAAAMVDGDDRPRGFLRRYRLPIGLAIVAVTLYLGSIVYIVLVRGQIGT